MHRARLLLLAFLVTGCGTLPAQRGIHIDKPAPATVHPLADTGLSLRFMRFPARNTLQERNLAYAEAAAPETLVQAATIVWDDPPETATIMFLAAALTNAGADVIPSGLPGVPTYYITGTLQHFELIGGTTGTALVGIDVTLTDAKTGLPWLATTFCARAAAADRSVPALRTAFQTALGDIAGQLVGAIAARQKSEPARPAASC